MSGHRRRRVLAGLGALLVLALVLVDRAAGCTAEQRVQSVRSDARVDLVLRDGVPTWITDQGEHHNRACRPAPGGLRVAALGSSILHGSGVVPDQSWAPALQALLPGPAGCVHNLAEPASAFETQLALARHLLPALAPDLVLWEIWGNSPHRFTVVGDVAWNFGPLRPEGGGPPSLLGLPFEEQLFRWSGTWRLLSVQQDPPPPPSGGVGARWQPLIEDGLDPALALIRSLGARLVLVAVTPLDRPFAQTAERLPEGHQLVRGWARDHDVPWIDVAAAWTDLDPEDLRLDPCCHLNPAGHAALAELLAERLGPPPASWVPD